MNISGRHIAVTGASGFIGRHVVETAGMTGIDLTCCRPGPVFGPFDPNITKMISRILSGKIALIPTRLNAGGPWPDVPVPVPVPFRRLWDCSRAESDPGWTNCPYEQSMKTTF